VTNRLSLKPQVLEATESCYKLRLKDGSTEMSVDRDKVQVFYRNPPEVEAADDLLSLPNLDEANILHSLRVRWVNLTWVPYHFPLLFLLSHGMIYLFDYALFTFFQLLEGMCLFVLGQDPSGCQPLASIIFLLFCPTEHLRLHHTCCAI